eukprot:15327670-Ditylum_brightwellii.AAC.2
MRTEGIAQLSLLTFLKHYCSYNSVTIVDNTCIHYTDNKSTIKHMELYHWRTIKNPRECLAPDYDIQTQVEAIFNEMQADIPTKWAKDHQDKNKSFEDLQWEEVLNI